MNLEVMVESARGQQVIKEHTDILNKIEKKDKMAARQALYYHFDNTVRILRERIKKAKNSESETKEERHGHRYSQPYR